MNRNDFAIRLASLRVDDSISPVTNAGLLLVDLLMCRGQWSGPAILSMLYDTSSEDPRDTVRTSAWASVLGGCSAWASRTNHMVVTAPMQFAHWALKHDRVSILADIVWRGVPQGIVYDSGSSLSTTPAGRLLDRMSSVLQSSDASHRHFHTPFLEAVGNDDAQLRMPTLRAAAELQVYADPNHPRMQTQGPVLSALLNEALMSQHIANAAAPAATTLSSAPSARRQARAL